MTTIRRTLVILILLAIVFFIYRGIDPQGADHLLTQARTFPGRFLGTKNSLSLGLAQDAASSGAVVPLSLTGKNTTGSASKLAQHTGILYTGSGLLGGQLSDLHKEGTGTVKSLLTGGKLTILSLTGTVNSPSKSPALTGSTILSPKKSVSSLQKVVSPKKTTTVSTSSSRLSQQELRDTNDILSHLFQ